MKTLLLTFTFMLAAFSVQVFAQDKSGMEDYFYPQPTIVIEVTNKPEHWQDSRNKEVKMTITGTITKISGEVIKLNTKVVMKEYFPFPSYTLHTGIDNTINLVFEADDTVDMVITIRYKRARKVLNQMTGKKIQLINYGLSEGSIIK